MSQLIFDMVKADLDERDRKGHAEYGKQLRSHDGRDTLWDAYEEALDLAVYLRKMIAERDLDRKTDASRLSW